MATVLASPPTNMEEHKQPSAELEKNDFLESRGRFGGGSTVELENFPTEGLIGQQKRGKEATGSQEDGDTENTTPSSSCDNSQDSRHVEEEDNRSLSLEEHQEEEEMESSTTAGDLEIMPTKEQDAPATGQVNTAVATSDDGPKSSRRVSFTNVEIREYPRCLGDHPCVVGGPPLSIGWKHTGRYVLDLDKYEQGRQDDIIAKAAAQIAKDAKEAAEARKAKAAESGVEPVEGEEEEEEVIDEEELKKVLLEKLKKKPRKRKNPLEYNLSCRTRIMILQDECNAKKNPEAKDLGVHVDGAEIKSRIREMRKIKVQRLHSQAFGEFDDVSLAVEGCRRKMKNMFKSRKSKKEQEQYKKALADACSNTHSVPKVQKRRSSLKSRKLVDITANGKF